jgi:hypothetical protein
MVLWSNIVTKEWPHQIFVRFGVVVMLLETGPNWCILMSYVVNTNVTYAQSCDVRLWWHHHPCINHSMCTITTVSLDHVVTTVNLDAVFAFVAIVGSVIPLVALMMHNPSCHQHLCLSALMKCLKTQQNWFFFMFGMDVMPLDAITFFFPPWRWGGSSTQAWMPTYVSILCTPQIIWVWRAMVEWYIDKGKPKNSEKNLSQCHFFHYKSHMN